MVWLHRTCSWKLELVNFKLHAILLKWISISLRAYFHGLPYPRNTRNIMSYKCKWFHSISYECIEVKLQCRQRPQCGVQAQKTTHVCAKKVVFVLHLMTGAQFLYCTLYMYSFFLSCTCLLLFSGFIWSTVHAGLIGLSFIIVFLKTFCFHFYWCK